MSELTSGVKRVALKLQALNSKDRRWLLNRLSLEQRKSVELALQELRSFSLSPSEFYDVLQDLEREERRSDLVERSKRFWAWADNARIERLSGQLSPASLSIFMEGLDAEQRDRIEDVMAPAALRSVQHATKQQRGRPSSRVLQVVREAVFRQGGQ